jgi:hypothetical protein
VTRLEVREPLPLPVRQERGLIGGVVGILLGAAAGYAVAIPRVRRLEQHHDGPFQQIDYLIDPFLGGLIGGIVGFNVGYWKPARWTVRFP